MAQKRRIRPNVSEEHPLPTEHAVEPTLAALLGEHLEPVGGCPLGAVCGTLAHLTDSRRTGSDTLILYKIRRVLFGRCKITGVLLGGCKIGQVLFPKSP